jgi:hypothetical protein
MIPRYTLPEMGAIWNEETRFRLFVEVEVAVVRARARRGLVPAADLAAIEEAPTPSPERVHQLDAELHHDVIAFLTAYGEGVGEAARHVHYGMTSSDLLDPTLALQLTRAGDLLARRLDRLVAALADRALEHRDTLCLGRTHGVAAEPTTFGLKLAGHAFAFDRDRRRLAAARRAVAVGTISGAVGTYANLPAEIEAEVLDQLGQHLVLDVRREVGVGADRAGELADGDRVARGGEPAAVAVDREGVTGELEPEGGRLGGDPVGAAEAERVAVLQRPVAQRRDQAVEPRGEQPGRLDQLERQRGVEQVRRGHAVVDVPRRRTDALAVGAEESDHVVVELPVQLVDALRPWRWRRFDRGQVRGRHQPASRPCADDGDLDPGEELEAVLLAPDRAHLGQGVARDHREIIALLRAAVPPRAAA